MYSSSLQTTSNEMGSTKDFGYSRLFHHQGLPHVSSPISTQPQPSQQSINNGGTSYQYANSTYGISRERVYSASNSSSSSILHPKYMESRNPVLQRSSSLPSQNSPSPPYLGSGGGTNTNVGSQLQYGSSSHHYGSMKPASYPSNNPNPWYNTSPSISSGGGGAPSSLYHPPQPLESLDWQNGAAGYPGAEQGRFDNVHLFTTPVYVFMCVNVDIIPVFLEF